MAMLAGLGGEENKEKATERLNVMQMVSLACLQISLVTWAPAVGHVGLTSSPLPPSSSCCCKRTASSGCRRKLGR